MTTPMANPTGDERRRMVRNRIVQTVRVRPSVPSLDNFDDVTRTINASRSGIYFKAWRDSYFKEMHLLVTYPYSTGPGALNQEFVGRVVRIDPLPGFRRGIAVELLMPLQLSAYEPPR